jgi:Glycosyltransferase family 87
MSKTMDWLKRLATCQLLDVGAILVTISVIALWAAVLPSCWIDYDFNNFYMSGRMLLEGQNPYTTSMHDMSQSLGFRFSEDIPIAGYPPSFLYVFAALATLPPLAAFIVWLALEIGCLIVLLWLTHRLLGERLSRRGWLFVVTLTIISRTVSFSLYFSQVQLLLAVFVLGAYAAHRAGRHSWACLAVSAAGILKFYPFVLLPWFVWSGGGTMRTRVYRLLGALGFAFGIFVLTGPGFWRDFLQHAIPMAKKGAVGRTFHFSLAAFVTNLGFWYHGFNPTPEASRWWWFLGTGAGSTAIAVAYGICLMAVSDLEAQFCLLCVAMLIGTVTVEGHYFVFLVFPLTVMAARIATKPTLGKVIYLALLLMAMNLLDPPDIPFLWRHLLLYIIVSDVPLYGLFGLAVFFWWELSIQRELTPRVTDG